MNDLMICSFNSLDSEIQKTIQDVFWQNSTYVPKTTKQKEKFFYNWLGKYLQYFPQHTFCLIHENIIVSYIASYIFLESNNFCSSNFFSSFPSEEQFFLKTNLSQLYPAHFHINTLPLSQGKQYGKRLLLHLEQYLLKKNISGTHLFTQLGHRNNAFYLNNQYTPIFCYKKSFNLICFAKLIIKD